MANDFAAKVLLFSELRKKNRFDLRFTNYELRITINRWWKFMKKRLILRENLYISKNSRTFAAWQCRCEYAKYENNENNVKKTKITKIIYNHGQTLDYH